MLSISTFKKIFFCRNFKKGRRLVVLFKLVSIYLCSCVKLSVKQKATEQESHFLFFERERERERVLRAKL